MQKVAFLTGGGCAPGLDAFAQTFVRMLYNHFEVYGIIGGWEGIVQEKLRTKRMTLKGVSGLSRSGGTGIKTSRINPFPDTDTPKSLIMQQNIRENYRNFQGCKLEGIVAFGGDDTLSIAASVHHKLDLNVISVPKTMDLDLNGTDYSVGFHAYCEAVFRNAIPGFIETLKAHERIGVLEVFGRYSGFTAVQIGLASDACFIAIPEMEVDLDQLAHRVKEAKKRQGWGLVVVAEAINVEAGDTVKIDPHGHKLLSEKKVGEFVASQIEQMTGIESRAFQATHPFRGVASAYDAVMGVKLGIHAATMVLTRQWNRMIAIYNDETGFDTNLYAFQPRRIIKRESWWWETTKLRNSGQI